MHILIGIVIVMAILAMASPPRLWRAIQSALGWIAVSSFVLLALMLGGIIIGVIR